MLDQKDLELIAGVVAKAVEPVRTEIEQLKEDVGELKEEVGQLRTDVEQLKEDVGQLKEEVGELRTDVEQLKEEVGELKEEVGQLKKNAERVDKEVRVIQLTLENETNRNIKQIAEGHLDLSRKLNDALKFEQEREMLSVRVNVLESEVRKLKEQVATIA